MVDRHRLLIVGGGFGGLYAAQALRRAALDITLIDRRNFHLFQPLLYQVATGALSPANIAAPLRSLFQWAWNYFTRGRSARLITEVPERTTQGGVFRLPSGSRTQTIA